MIRSIQLFLCLFLITSNVGAAENAIETLQTALHNLLTLDKQVKSDNRDAMLKKLETDVLAYFSFNYMTEWVARPFEQELTATQYTQLTGQLQGLFLTRLLQALGNGESSYSFNLLAPRPNLRARELIVTAQVQQLQKTTSEIHFRLYRNQEGWKIFDMMINQDSMMNHFRTYFQQQVQQHGVIETFGK